MRRFLACSLLSVSASVAQQTAVPPAARSLTEVRRIYVGELQGGKETPSLRELIIAGLNSTGLFVLTDRPESADAILKGAANDTAFVDSFESDKSVTTRADGGVRQTLTSRGGGGYGGTGGGERESYRIRERKHEAFASVRLVNRAGDTLWSTTQESLGAKFRSASTDVAAKIARQIALDMQRPGQPARTIATQ